MVQLAISRTNWNSFRIIWANIYMQINAHSTSVTDFADADMTCEAILI